MANSTPGLTVLQRKRSTSPARTKSLVGILLVAGVLVPAAWLIGRTAPRAARPDLRLIENVSIATLDPAAISQLQDIRVAMQVFEGLFVFNPNGAAPRPGCITDYVVDHDRINWEFHIRPDARWSNGDPVTAGDFIFAWRRAFEPGTAQDYAFFFEAIDGVKDYVAWRRAEIERIGRLPKSEQRSERDKHLELADVRFRDHVGLFAAGPVTLRVRLARPVAYWLDLLTAPVFGPLHEASVSRFRVYDDVGQIYYDPRWIRPGQTEFNGAYVLADWRFKQRLTLRANPHYWGRDSVRIRSVEVLDVVDSNTAWLMYEDGHVDLLPSIKVSYAPELLAKSNSPLPGALNHAPDGRDDLHACGAFGTYFYNFNCQPRLPDGSPNPIANRRLRRAIALAIDRKTLCESVLRQDEIPTTVFIPPGAIAGYPAVDGLAFNPAAAQAELRAAGYPKPADVPELVIRYNNEGNHGLIAQTIEAMLRKNLGIRVRSEGQESQTFSDSKQRQDFLIARASWYGDYSDPTTYLDVLTSGNGNNDSGYADPHYDALLAQAEKTADPAERMKILAQAETRLVRETLPILPLYHDVNVFAFRPDRLRGFTLNPRLLWLYQDLEARP